MKKLFDLLEEFKGRIIDVHSHIGSDQSLMLEGSIEIVIETMNRYGIRKSFISGVHSLLADFREGNRQVAKAVKEYPTRFCGLVAVNPYYEDEAIEELRKYILKLGFKGVKLHPFYFKISMVDELTIRIIEEVIKLKIPAMIHSYDGGIEVSQLADMFPDLTIVMYHMGGVKWREGIERVKSYDNVYAEISSSVHDRGMIEYAVEKLGDDRILFGIDMPYLDPAISLGKVLGARISKYSKEAILCQNAMKLLKM